MNILNKMKKIKLIIFHPYSHVGGADNSLKRLIEQLDTRFFSITFVSLNESFLKKDLKKKVDFIKINSGRALFSINKFRKIVKKIYLSKNFKKIIVFSNQNFANIISSFSLMNLPHIKKIFIDRNHLDELNNAQTIREKLKKKIIKKLIKITYRNANLVIGISKKLSTDLSNYCGVKVKTIYSPGYDKSIIKKANKKIKLKKKYKYIINVSRFTKRKDHYTTLMSFKLASEKIENLKLILIGYGPEYDNIIKLSRKLNIIKKIIIFKKLNNPYPYIKKSDLLILSSKYEGMGNILVEAITLGIPIISSNCNSGPSEILLNGKGGDLFKVSDYNELSKKIIKHFKDPKILKKKIKFSQKKLFRFDKKKHGKIYSKIFTRI